MAKIELWTAPLDPQGYMPTRMARIVVSEYSRSDDGLPELAPQLMTQQEVEYYADRLRAQLDKVVRDGARYFATPLLPEQ